MELTGKLKEELSKCETREEAKDKLKKAGIVLSDKELDSVAGGGRDPCKQAELSDWCRRHGLIP